MDKLNIYSQAVMKERLLGATNGIPTQLKSYDESILSAEESRRKIVNSASRCDNCLCICMFAFKINFLR